MGLQKQTVFEKRQGKILTRRPPETGARQPKGDKEHTARVHIALPRDWLNLIERAARQLGLGRSNFIVQAAHEKAGRDLKRKVKESFK